MEASKYDKPIDVTDLARTMRDKQARVVSPVSHAQRTERISQIVLLLRNLPDADFESCVSLVESIAERRAQITAKKKQKDSQKSENTRQVSDLLGSGNFGYSGSSENVTPVKRVS